MIGELDPRATVLSVARAHRWVDERGPNRGQAVEAILARVGLPPGQPWCAAFVSYIGRAVLGSDWPLPMTGGCAALGLGAIAKGYLNVRPEYGSIFLLWSPTLGRYRHTGFLIMPTTGGWRTIEGNTSPDGSPEGTGVYERVRAFDPLDRFIHWWE